MNLRLMALNIREFVPTLSMPVIKQRINMRYKQLLGAEEWEFLKDSTTVNLKGIYSSGTDTVALTNGLYVVVGTGTTFTDHTQDDFIRFGSEPQPYVISTITDNLNLVLATTYGGATAASSDFSIYRTYYTPAAADVAEITSIVYQSVLNEVSQGFLNRMDPERSSTGSPRFCCITKKTQAHGLVEFEIWPIPDQDYVVTVYYKKWTTELTSDTDEPVFRPELIEAGALWDCFRLAFAITQNPAWIGMARDARMDFERLLREAIGEDLGTTSMPRQVRDVMGGRGWDDDFMLSHDVEGVI